MVADEDEGVGEAEGSEAGWEGDLRGFVDDAVVELAAGEDWARDEEGRAGGGQTGSG